jgi:hypothetical protein
MTRIANEFHGNDSEVFLVGGLRVDIGQHRHRAESPTGSPQLRRSESVSGDYPSRA